MNTDWYYLQEKYEGLWVALADDNGTVVGSGDTPEEARGEAKSGGYEHPALAFVPMVAITFALSQYLV
jgi:hypothetical protein